MLRCLTDKIDDIKAEACKKEVYYFEKMEVGQEGCQGGEGVAGGGQAFGNLWHYQASVLFCRHASRGLFRNHLPLPSLPVPLTPPLLPPHPPR